MSKESLVIKQANEFWEQRDYDQITSLCIESLRDNDFSEEGQLSLLTFIYKSCATEKHYVDFATNKIYSEIIEKKGESLKNVGDYYYAIGNMHLLAFNTAAAQENYDLAKLHNLMPSIKEINAAISLNKKASLAIEEITELGVVDDAKANEIRENEWLVLELAMVARHYDTLYNIYLSCNQKSDSDVYHQVARTIREILTKELEERTLKKAYDESIDFFNTPAINPIYNLIDEFMLLPDDNSRDSWILKQNPYVINDLIALSKHCYVNGQISVCAATFNKELEACRDAIRDDLILEKIQASFERTQKAIVIKLPKIVEITTEYHQPVAPTTDPFIEAHRAYNADNYEKVVKLCDKLINDKADHNILTYKAVSSMCQQLKAQVIEITTAPVVEVKVEGVESVDVAPKVAVFKTVSSNSLSIVGSKEEQYVKMQTAALGLPGIKAQDDFLKGKPLTVVEKGAASMPKASVEQAVAQNAIKDQVTPRTKKKFHTKQLEKMPSILEEMPDQEQSDVILRTTQDGSRKLMLRKPASDQAAPKAVSQQKNGAEDVYAATKNSRATQWKNPKLSSEATTTKKEPASILEDHSHQRQNVAFQNVPEAKAKEREEARAKEVEAKEREAARAKEAEAKAIEEVRAKEVEAKAIEEARAKEVEAKAIEAARAKEVEAKEREAARAKEAEAKAIEAARAKEVEEAAEAKKQADIERARKREENIAREDRARAAADQRRQENIAREERARAEADIERARKRQENIARDERARVEADQKRQETKAAKAKIAEEARLQKAEEATAKAKIAEEARLQEARLQEAAEKVRLKEAEEATAKAKIAEKAAMNTPFALNFLNYILGIENPSPSDCYEENLCFDGHFIGLDELIRTTMVKRVFKALERNHSNILKTLQLINNDMGNDNHMRALSDLLGAIQFIEVLNISKDNFAETDVEVIEKLFGTLLTKCLNLHTLFWKQNNMNGKSLEYLSNFLQKSKSINVADLSENNLGKLDVEVIKKFFKGLNECKSLNHLFLKGNNLKGEHLYDFLRHTNIKTIDLSEGGISLAGDSGDAKNAALAELAKAYADNPRLDTVHLDDVYFTKEQIEFFQEEMVKRTLENVIEGIKNTVKTPSMVNCAYLINVAHCFTELPKEKKEQLVKKFFRDLECFSINIKMLDLRENDMWNSSFMKALCEFLRTNPKVEEINLENNSIASDDKDSILKLASACAKNKHLKRIKLGNNKLTSEHIKIFQSHAGTLDISFVATPDASAPSFQSAAAEADGDHSPVAESSEEGVSTIGDS